MADAREEEVQTSYAKTVDEDEWYPMYSLSDWEQRGYGPIIELTEEEQEDYKKVCDRFQEWQDRLAAAYK
jgi:hypothetical protein